MPVNRVSEFNVGRTRDSSKLSIDELAKDIQENGIRNHIQAGFHQGIPALHNGNHRYLAAKKAEVDYMPTAVPNSQHKSFLH